ncbi:Methylamine utilization protein MauE [Phycisphaerae bacterium RAS2]|nr:Methylamine utilization protein MauE [Phycisphaerae bacterium RAS2]
MTADGEALSIPVDLMTHEHGATTPLWRTVTAWVCALGVAGVFLYAGFEKIVEPRQFVIAISNYRIVPERGLNAMALILPWLECLAAVALILPATRRAGAILICGMLVMFIIAVSYSALYKGLNIDCGCFGKGNPSAAGVKTIVFDSALLLATIASVFLSPNRRRAAA